MIPDLLGQMPQCEVISNHDLCIVDPFPIHFRLSPPFKPPAEDAMFFPYLERLMLVENTFSQPAEYLTAMLEKIVIPHPLRTGEVFGLTLGFGLSTIAVSIRLYTKAFLARSLKAEDCECFEW